MNMRQQSGKWVTRPMIGLMVILMGILLGITPCQAQEKSKETLELGAMTVTAQKTEEKTLDVPIALSIFSESSMEDKNLTDLEDLSYLVPNLYVINMGDFGPYQPSLRGLAAEKGALGTSVGLYIDGAVTHTGLGFSTQLDDIERVEVLRGPQGTLYGSGAEVGAINVITKKPGNETEGKISLEYGEDNKQQFGVTFRTPIVKDKFYIGVTGRYYSKDGFIKSGKDGSIVDDRQNYFGKIYLRATPSERLELSLISSLYQSDDGGLRRNRVSADDPRVFGGDADEEIKNRFESHSFKIAYKFDTFNVSSTTVYSKNELHSFLDVDYSLSKLYHYDITTPIESTSEELKIDGVSGSLKWLLGLFTGKAEKTGGWTAESDIVAYQHVRKQDFSEENQAVFGHLNYVFSDKVSLLGGIRFEESKAGLNDKYIAASGATTEYSDSTTFSDVSPKLAVEYKPDETLMTYLTIAKGYRMGGYFARAANGYPKDYDSETLWNYELGMKSSLLNNRLFINADVFYMDVTNMQTVNYVALNQAYMANAAKSGIYGFELDANYEMTGNINLFGVLGFTEAKFNEYEDFLGDYQGNSLPFAPKYNYALGGKFRGDTGMYASVKARGYGKMYLDNANEYEKDPYMLVDVKIGYEFNKLDTYLYANNLFDENYDLVGSSGVYTLLNPPREVGVKVAYRF